MTQVVQHYAHTFEIFTLHFMFSIIYCAQVQALAQELQSLHFSEAQESTRKVASELRAILVSLEGACLAHEDGTVSKT